MRAHCRVCSLGDDHPGIAIDSQQVCNLCRMDLAAEMLANFRYTNEVFQAFQEARPNPDGPFDCLFMYSGGKDSTYLLDKFVNEQGKRVAAFTFDVPFESSHAADNIRLAKQRIPATYVADKDDENIREMMREVFNKPPPAKPGRYLDEKLPCVSCRTFFVIRAILYAFRRHIPYIVICADPQQILTMESNVVEVVRGFYRTFGQRAVASWFGGELQQILFADEKQLPKIVFPFIAMRHDYDPDRIVSELKEKGLYTSSPLETHCTLFPLLNYYSFKHWNCMFYKLNASSRARADRNGTGAGRSTFSIKFPDALNILDVERRMKEVTLAIAAGEGDHRTQRESLAAVFRDLGADDEAARFVADGFLNMPAVAADLGIRLS